MQLTPYAFFCKSKVLSAALTFKGFRYLRGKTIGLILYFLEDSCIFVWVWGGGGGFGKF